MCVCVCVCMVLVLMCKTCVIHVEEMLNIMVSNYVNRCTGRVMVIIEGSGFRNPSGRPWL